MKILYVTFVDFGNATSGSSVRPKKIYDAFLEQGHEVVLLTGLQNRRGERWKNCIEFFKKIRNRQYDLCYIEPPSGPIFNFCDHLLMIYISRVKKVPTGLFYRDAYWKFAEWYKIGKLKQFIINAMHRFDLGIIKWTCSKVYFPSDMMADLFSFKYKEALPPGCEDLYIKKKDIKDIQLIYVGGMSEEYGGELLLQALDKINAEKRINLHLVCRNDDRKYIGKYEGKEWLNIYHVSGEKLRDIYAKANVAIIPRKIDFYMNFSMPVKLLEYVSFEIPIISTNCTEVANFINKNKIGVVCEDNVSSLYNVFMNLTIDDLSIYKENIVKTKVENTWGKRVEQIIKLKK